MTTFSGSSFGADLFCLLPTAGEEIEPSLHVLEAGLGGGGMDAESYSSFALSFSRGSSGSFGRFGG